MTWEFGSEGKDGLVVIDANGEHPNFLAEGRDRDSFPCWSPDGRRILFQSYSDTDDSRFVVGEIWSIHEDGGHLTRLGSGWNPFFSRDGRMVIFVKRGELHIMDATGAGERGITKLGGEISSPALSPDGDWVVFSCTRDGNADIYVTNLDGSPVLRLTDHEAKDEFPVWAPR